MEQRYKFRIIPTCDQEKLIQATFSSCTFLYNWFMHEQLRCLDGERRTLDYYACTRLLEQMKLTNTWLKTMDPMALRGAVVDARRDFLHWLSSRRPVEKLPQRAQSGMHQRYPCSNAPGAVAFEDGRVNLPFVGKVDCVVPACAGPVQAAWILQRANGVYEAAVRCQERVEEEPPFSFSIGYFDPAEYGERMYAEREKERYFHNWKNRG